MLDQYFGIKELHECVLRAKQPMRFGSRNIEIDEPVLYFENVSLANLNEGHQPVYARGGWANLPRVIWEDRSEVQFTLSEGVMSSISMGILLSADVLDEQERQPLLVPLREGPFDLDKDGCLDLSQVLVTYPIKKTFIFEYDRNVAQKKLYGEIIDPEHTYTKRKDIYGVEHDFTRLKLYQDKDWRNQEENERRLADKTKQYIVDYYYEYKDEALIYTVQKERFNGLFTLEGKFYAKDENEGLNYTNLIYMPKVRVVSDINLRLGERANPTVGVFNIIGLPESVDANRNNLIMEITRLNSDIDDI